MTQHKVKRMEQEYQDLVIRTEYLRASKEKIRQDIQFYKSVISKLVPLPPRRPSLTTSHPSDLCLTIHPYHIIIVLLQTLFKYLE